MLWGFNTQDTIELFRKAIELDELLIANGNIWEYMGDTASEYYVFIVANELKLRTQVADPTIEYPPISKSVGDTGSLKESLKYYDSAIKMETSTFHKKRIEAKKGRALIKLEEYNEALLYLNEDIREDIIEKEYCYIMLGIEYK